MSLNALDVLSGWAENDVLRKDQMITFVIGAILLKLGETSIEITSADLHEMPRGHSVRCIMSADGRSMTYRLIRANETPDPELPLEGTSGQDEK